MDGFAWIVKNALAGAGVEIHPDVLATIRDLKPDEIKQAVDTAKVLIPKIASDYNEQKLSLARIEKKVDDLIGVLYQLMRVRNTPVDVKQLAAEELTV